MAVSFTGTRIGDWTYKRGTLSANFHTVETQTSDMVCGRGHTYRNHHGAW